jgi:hypothetical protein
MFFFFRVDIYLHVSIVALVILHQVSRCSCLDMFFHVAIKVLFISRQDVPVSTYLIIFHQVSRCSYLDISPYIAIEALIISRQDVLVSTYLLHIAIEALIILRQDVLVLTSHSKCYIMCANILTWLYTPYVSMFIHF